MTPPLVSIVRVIDPVADAWTTLSRARLSKHTPDAYEIIDSIIDTTFGAAANRGAVRAHADHLIIMRGDTLVGPGWLEPLLSASLRWDAVVTPCVCDLDGTVLDAGLLATGGGELVAVGRGSTRADPMWSFVREVSSPSPACFVVPRRTFLAAGGFDLSLADAWRPMKGRSTPNAWDTSFTPQVETANLAFALRARGRRILFQPESTVQAAGDSGVRSHELGPVFRQRWERALADLPVSASSDDERGLVEVRDGHASARLLVIDDRVPHADRGGGDPRMHRILTELAASWPSLRVTLFALTDTNAAAYGRSLWQAGIEVVYGVDLEDWLSSRRCLFDVVMISRPRALLDVVQATQPQARLVYDMEAVHVRRHQRMIPLVPPDDAIGVARAARDLLAIEVDLIVAADVVLCVSEDDRSFAACISPATPSILVSHAVEPPRAVPSFDEREGMIFFGAFWNPGSPNEDAVRFLVKHVMPIVWAEDPSIRLTIAGADPTPDVLRLAGPDVDVVGYVSDPYVPLTRARVHVVPIRIGAGIKLRLIDSMAAGLPFVTTAVGAEGLPLGSLGSTIVADTPVEIARCALALYRDMELWMETQRLLCDIARTHYSAPVLQRQIGDAMTAVGIANGSHPRFV